MEQPELLTAAMDILTYREGTESYAGAEQVIRECAENLSTVRVDLFKPLGKYVATLEVECTQPTDWDLPDAIQRDIETQYPNYAGSGYWAVCPEPYSDYAYPVMVVLDGDYS